MRPDLHRPFGRGVGRTFGRSAGRAASLRWSRGDETPSDRCGPSPVSRTRPRGCGGTGRSSPCLVPRRSLEGILRDDLAWRPVAIVLGVALMFPLLWRRTHPLAAVAVAFGAIIAGRCRAALRRRTRAGRLYTTAYVLLLPYSLCRWGSRSRGRDRAGDHPGHRRACRSPATTPASVEAVLGSVILLFPAALGASVRYRADVPAPRDRSGQAPRARAAGPRAARHRRPPRLGHRHPGPGRAGRRRRRPRRRRGRARGHRGGGIAHARRDAHHGRRPARGRGARRSPRNAGVADIERLAAAVPATGRVSRWSCRATSTTSRPSVEAAVYRLAQESITNAMRHARHATRIRVCGRRRDRLRPPDRQRRRRRRARQRRPASGYGIVGHDRAGHAARRHARGRPEPGPGLDRRRRAAQERHRRMTIRVHRRRRSGDRPHRAHDDPRRPARHRGGRRRPPTGARRWRWPASCAPTCACSTSACPTWTASRPPGSSPDPTSTTRSRSSSSPPSTSTSTCTAPSRRAPGASCSRTPGPSC